MTGSAYKRVVGVFVAGSMLFGSTAAVASTQPVSATQVDPWAVLSVMSGGASAAAVCGAAAVAVAAPTPPAGCVLPAVDTPPPVAANPPPQPIPVPPVEAAGGGLGISPLLLGLLAVAAGVGLYFALRNHHHNGVTTPVSPA